MPPKKEPVDNDNTLFLLACLANLEESPKWTEIAAMMGIAGTESLPAGKLRKSNLQLLSLCRLIIAY